MSRRPLFKYFIIALAILSISGTSALARIDDPNINAALRNYNNNHYRTALKYFKIAEKSWIDE
jgi:hypothetical protein